MGRELRRLSLALVDTLQIDRYFRRAPFIRGAASVHTSVFDLRSQNL